MVGKTCGADHSGTPRVGAPGQVLQVREDQDHLSVCQGYSDLRQDLDLENDNDLVEFFRQVMARRERQGWD